jgi:hypothetical protein
MQKVLITSSNRTAGSNESFTIQHDLPVNTWRKVKLLQARLPMTYSNIVTGTNDQFTITGVSSGANVITIPQSNYDGNTLASTTQDLINAVTSPQVYMVTYNSSLGVITFSGSENFTLTFGVNSFGFTPGTTASAASHTSDIAGGVNNSLSMGGYISITTNLIGGIYNGVTELKQNVVQTRSLEVVPLCTSGTVVNYRTSDIEPFSDIYLNDINTITFELQYVDGSVVDLNGSEWSCTLLFSS